MFDQYVLTLTFFDYYNSSVYKVNTLQIVFNNIFVCNLLIVTKKTDILFVG